MAEKERAEMTDRSHKQKPWGNQNSQLARIVQWSVGAEWESKRHVRRWVCPPCGRMIPFGAACEIDRLRIAGPSTARKRYFVLEEVR